MKKLKKFVILLWILNLTVFMMLFILLVALGVLKLETHMWRTSFSIIMLIAVYNAILYLLVRHLIMNPIHKVCDLAENFSKNSIQKKIDNQITDDFSMFALAINKLEKYLYFDSILNIENQEIVIRILNTVPLAIMFIEMNDTFSYKNQLAKEFLMKWSNITECDISNEISPELRPIMETVVKTHNKVEHKIELGNSTYLLKAIPIFIESQSALQCVMILVHDVTEQENLEKMRSSFVTNIMHDLRTPLSMIQGYSEAIKDNMAETLEEKNEMAKIINEESYQMMILVNSLLELSKFQGGYIRLEKEEVETIDFIRSIMTRFKNVIEEENIHFTLNVDSEVRMMFIDPAKMHQVLFNLIDNAIRFVKINQKSSKTIQIEVRYIEKSKYFTIAVTDNGIGIPDEDIPFIFERFYKVGKQDAVGIKTGTGIGLSIVKTIVDQHDGHIYVQSVEGDWTKFIIELPYTEILN